MDPQRFTPGDPGLIEDIVKYVKAKGMFDEFRQECLADMDTKSSFQNLTQRIDGYTSKFLKNEKWHPDMNKNELRNKLRRSIEESDIIDVGTDHVVEQVINSKIEQVFFPRITDVVHQHIKQQNELSSKMFETASSDNASSSEKAFYDMSDSKTKSSISDPIADILSFSFSKSKPMPTTSTHVKADSIQVKLADLPKLEKLKKEKPIPVTEKSTLESPTKNTTCAIVTETKPVVGKEKQKIENEPEVYQEVSKHVLKEEFKCEKKKTEDVKAQSSETVTPVEENKANVSIPVKPLISEKKDFDKNKQKLKTSNTQKPSGSSTEIKKPKKESSDDKPSDKVTKIKSVKSSKELSSPKKSISSMKSVVKEEKTGESSKSKSFDTSSSKTESSVKKGSKSSSIKKDNSKHKGHGEKTDKSKIPKSSDKNDHFVHYDSPNSEKASKNIHYSSSQDSSQGSDQEKSSSSSSKKEKQKHFSKHAEKEKSEHSVKTTKTVSDKNRLSDADESPKKLSSEKCSKHEQLKDTTAIEVAKLSSFSNSFGSTSSVSSSSNASKDNLSNSDEASENSVKKKKKQKETDSCQNPLTTLPSPPPPPPSSGSLLASSAEMSISEDTQSSSEESEVSNSEEKSEESSNVPESESKESVSKTLKKSTSKASTSNMNDFYDIFLYSSSSSEFEGFENSPENEKKENVIQDIHSSELSVSSVHTSDLSSYDDELSDENPSFLDESNTTGKEQLTLKKAQEFVQKEPTVFEKNKNAPIKNSQETDPISVEEKCIENLSSCVKESPPSEPTRSLRRERKLNPRYASSEYTSIFNSKKETFITKRSSPPAKSNPSSSPNIKSKCGRKKNSLKEKKMPKKCSVKSKINAMHQDEVEQFQKTNNFHNSESHDKKDVTKISDMSCSNEMNSIFKKEMFQENNKCTGNDHLKFSLKLNLQKNPDSNKNSYSVKYKLSVADQSSPVDCLSNQSSEFIPNENKPFNSEKQSTIKEKILGDDSLKGLDVTFGIKKDLFCKQRANNNGDVLGQKDIFPNNSHGKAISNAGKKTSETGTSKELNAL